MDSPYSPGFGARPAVLVGRDVQLGRAAASLTRVANSGTATSALVLTGARGMGKTVTLGVIAEMARDRGFVTASVAFDSVSDNVQLLAARLAEAAAPLESRTSEGWAWLRRRLAELEIEVNAGLVKVITAPTGSRGARESAGAGQRQVLADLLVATARLSREHDGPGLVILLDELQEAPHDQLVIIANAIQDALGATGTRTSEGAGGAPVVVFAAGLPQTPDRVMAAASFTERFDFRALDRLDPDDAERALLEPAVRVGVTWTPAAAFAVLEAAGGSPYLIQRFGDEAWLLADPGPGGTIEHPVVSAAIADVRESLAGGMFRGRWAKATPAEQLYLVAVAQVVDPHGIARSRDVTAVTGRTTPQWSRVRKALIDKGLVESAGTGLVRFTMPGFAEFARDQVDLPWLWDTTQGGIVRPPEPPALPAGPPALPAGPTAH